MAEGQHVALGLIVPRDQAIYLDLNNLVSLDRNPELIADLKAINGSLYNLFTCRIGSRVFQPKYGCNLLDYVFEPTDQLTADRILVEVDYAIGEWEPRIFLDYQKSTVVPVTTVDGFDCKLVYRILSTRLIGTYNFLLTK